MEVSEPVKLFELYSLTLDDGFFLSGSFHLLAPDYKEVTTADFIGYCGSRYTHEVGKVFNFYLTQDPMIGPSLLGFFLPESIFTQSAFRMEKRFLNIHITELQQPKYSLFRVR